MFRFTKMHGAGNDFIILYDLKNVPQKKRIQALCDRRRGIGADGLIALSAPDAAGVLTMRFFNCDGSPAEMCGNGLRCVTRFAHDFTPHAPGKKTFTFRTGAGLLTGKIISQNTVRIALNIVHGIEHIVFPTHEGDFLNTGVPHFVVEVEDVSTFDVCKWGRHYRFEKFPGNAGSNVDFMTRLTPDTYAIRTYERGVEDETQACGTGCAAAGFLLLSKFSQCNHFTLVTPFSDKLIITRKDEKSVYLTGPARVVFQGEMP